MRPAPSTSQLLGCLTDRRRAHSEAVAVRAAEAGLEHVDAEHLPDLVVSAALHDIGYAPAWAHTGFHPVDGARHLRELGFSTLVCHLVATHTAARAEALERGLDLGLFTEFSAPDLRTADRLQAVLTWADLNTGPDGGAVSVADRLEEILERYVPDDPVHRYVSKRRAWLLVAGSHPLGMLDAEPL